MVYVVFDVNDVIVAVCATEAKAKELAEKENGHIEFWAITN